MKNSRYIVIVGCGRLGSRLADELSRAGNSVVVIDRDESAFDELTPDFSGFRVDGDATHMAVLKQAKLNMADILIAATGEDNVNIMSSQVAKGIFGVSRVLARVLDPRKAETYARLGIETMCPTSVASEMFLRAVVDGAAEREGAGS